METNRKIYSYTDPDGKSPVVEFTHRLDQKLQIVKNSIGILLGIRYNGPDAVPTEAELWQIPAGRPRRAGTPPHRLRRIGIPGTGSRFEPYPKNQSHRDPASI